MTRKKKLLLNTATALIYQIITTLCGFVLPKFVIPYFGSSTNGLINSITQFLTIITLCEAGVGAVVQSTLYKPLADKDEDQISRIMTSSKHFFNNVMKLLAVYVIGLMIVFPLFIKGNYDYSFLYITSLVLILAFNYLAQYYLFISYKLLLNADQLSFIQLSIHSMALILNTVLTIVLIQLKASIHVVKLGSALVFFLQPLLLKLYVDKHYHVNTNMVLTEEPIKQKWNGLAQHIASVVLANTDTVVLTVFSTLENVSVYGVYNLVAHGMKQILVSSVTGVQAMLGNMYAKHETEALNKAFASFELVIHGLVTLIFTTAAILLIPFVRIYTVNFVDADYIVPLFGFMLVLAQATYCLRIPYNNMVMAAGHYKQTQTSAIIEACLNLGVSIVLVFNFGLVGVAIGTLVAMLYRTIYFAIYLSKNIINRPLHFFIRHMCADVIAALAMLGATCWIKLGSLSYLSWIWMALQVGVICLVISVAVQYAFFHRDFADAKRLLLRRVRK